MRILITGATGFIGRHLVAALDGGEHDLILTSRKVQSSSQKGEDWRVVQFERFQSKQDWDAVVADVDIVINTVGIFTQSKTQTFDAVHHGAPRALFEACKGAGVQRIIQVSALGTSDQAISLYHLSKRKAENALENCGVEWVILRPSLIIGGEGRSWQFFKALSILPIVPVIDNGQQVLQPVSIKDVVKAIIVSIDRREAVGCTINLVGQDYLTLQDYLRSLSNWMGRVTFTPLHVPYAISGPLAAIAQFIDHFPLNRDAVLMLRESRAYELQDCQKNLGFMPIGVCVFLAQNRPLMEELVAAKQYFLRSLVRFGLAFMWIMAGVASLFFYPVEESLDLLAKLSLSGATGLLALYGSALLDILLGLALIVRFHIRRVAIIQIALMIFYTLALSWVMPSMWSDPFGALAKNIPLIMTTLLMMSWSTE